MIAVTLKVTSAVTLETCCRAASCNSRWNYAVFAKRLHLFLQHVQHDNASIVLGALH